ncbi:uncharacterized protein LOC117238296 [Bombus vosnesenskii]|uniref:Uncharacterized protein LOC117238296 n=1 Tax=Bombus vosnesenskii TaxID=207650 RepID=A0A6J3L4H1_9HYME|nr:uncharacterized protein LOC117238296 [Bombus vosnesenskii]XP_033358995.1 uncharacterized protein LOC117238296 [Bombus vosnesenskii]
MFKRIESNRENEFSVPAKRPRYDIKRDSLVDVSTNNKDLRNKRSGKSDDIWGDDFAEEDIEEMDFVATQACLQEDSFMSEPNTDQKKFAQKYNSIPSTSKGVPNLNGSIHKLTKSIYPSQHNNERKGIENSKDISTIVSVDYKEFENKLINKKVYNSTFKLDENLVAESEYAKELEKLKAENKKLLDDFITKEGEAVFLRNQLQQIQLKAENDRLEKARLIEEQENHHRMEINAIYKEKEHLKTQLELQMFEVGNLMERCKLLENGNVRLTEPHINLNISMKRSKFDSPKNRPSIVTTKPVRVKETSVQTNTLNKSSYISKIWNPYFPLTEIPKLIYDPSQPEKSVVDIQIIEKIGRRNLPILQEEDTFRIFENPELVKPVTTMIDDKKLSVEFILPEIAALQRKTSSELEAEETIPIINKLIFTARELILSIVVVLQTISQAMKNDDIRDMNDIYFSVLYSTSDLNGKCVCSANAWHECERGVEARRVFGMLSYVTMESTYLSKYIAGKTHLLIESDESYKRYSCQMVRYNTWFEQQSHEFEMLKMILQFVVLVGSTRRSHQFSGLLCAIMMIIYNIHEKIGYCSEGMEYIYQIFKEIVFCRPLPYCYTLVSKLMMIFVKSTMYLRKLCINSQSINNWKGSLHFTPDACPLQIFLVQLENYDFDLLAAIDITDVLLGFVQYILQTDIIPLRSENLNSCNCCMKLLRFTIKTLCKCSEANLAAIENFKLDNFPVPKEDSCNLEAICAKHSLFNTRPSKLCIREIYRDKFSDEKAWSIMKEKQSKVLRDGRRFLSHVAICDPDFVIRVSDIEDSFHLFMRNLSAFKNFVLHENEQEAMNRIKQTFISDKTQPSEMEQLERSSSRKELDILSNFEKKFVQPLSARPKQNENYNKALVTFKSLFNIRFHS